MLHPRSLHTRLFSPRAIALLLTGVVAVALPPLAAAQVDYGIANVSVVPGTPGNVIVGFELLVDHPDSNYIGACDIRILHNGTPLNTHAFTGLREVFTACPTLAEDCPSRVCRKITGTWKSAAVDEQSSCETVGSLCYCPEIKFINVESPSSLPGLYRVIVDPDNQISELNEGNNWDQASFGPVPGLDSRGLVLAALLVLGSGLMFMLRRRRGEQHAA